MTFPDWKERVISASGACLITCVLALIAAVLYLVLVYDNRRGAPIGIGFFIPNVAAIAALTAFFLGPQGRRLLAVVLGTTLGMVLMGVLLVAGQIHEEVARGHIANQILAVSFAGVLPSLLLVGMTLLAGPMLLVRRGSPSKRPEDSAS